MHEVARARTCVCVYIYIYLCVCVCVCVYIYIYICVCVCVSLGAWLDKKNIAFCLGEGTVHQLCAPEKCTLVMHVCTHSSHQLKDLYEMELVFAAAIVR
jgi:hypothetical protein